MSSSSSTGSITGWLDQLKAGAANAAQPLWHRYFRRLVGLARAKLANAPRRVADEEDVALSAFDSFCRGVEHGRFPQLFDREDLWRLLVLFTARKASRLRRDQSRQKRGGGGHPEGGAAPSVAAAAAGGDDERLLEELLSTEPDPAFAAEMAEQCQLLLARLPDPTLRQIALRRMEGESVDEIARSLDLAPRSIKRKLQLIRSFWQDGPS